MVPRADQTIRWAMQPGAPANKKKITAAAISTHAKVFCLVEELPFLRRICPPPFLCCAILCRQGKDCETARAVVQ